MNMDHHLLPASTAQAAVLLAELLLFWSATVLHLLRLLTGTSLPDADTATDLTHAAMGVAMAAMLFPGTPAGADLPIAVVFAGLAAFFAVRAAIGDRNRIGDLAMGISAAAMTVMSIAGHHTGTPLMLTIAACLVGCAAAHGRILLTAHHRHAHSLSPGQSRSLLLAPHLSAVGMTLTMAYLFAV